MKFFLWRSDKTYITQSASLVRSQTLPGVTNPAIVSWWIYLSLEPETIGFAMMKTSST